MTQSEIDRRYADLPIDTSDERLVKHLVRVAWHVLAAIDPSERIEHGAQLIAHGELKAAVKSLVPEREGDTIAADSMRRILSAADLAPAAPCPEVYHEATGDEHWPDTAAELALIRERDAACQEPLNQIQADRRRLLRSLSMSRTIIDGLRSGVFGPRE